MYNTTLPSCLHLSKHIYFTLQLNVVPNTWCDVRALKMKTINDKNANAEIIWGNIYLHLDKHLIKVDQLCPNPSPLIPPTPYLILES